MVHPRAGFGKIGETDAQFEQRSEFVWLMSPGGDPDLMQRAPEAVAGMRVVVADTGGSRAGRRANEDEAKVGTELIWQAVEMGVGHPASAGSPSLRGAIATKQSILRMWRDGLLRGACHRAALGADPSARNDDSATSHHALTRRLPGLLFGCDRLCRLGRADHQKCSRRRRARQPPAPVDFRRVGIDRAFVGDRVVAIAGRLVTLDEGDCAARAMTRNRRVVGAERAARCGAGFSHVPSERATGFDQRRQERDDPNSRLRIGAVPDAGKTVGHRGPNE